MAVSTDTSAPPPPSVPKQVWETPRLVASAIKEDTTSPDDYVPTDDYLPPQS